MTRVRQMSLTPELVALCFRKEEDRSYGSRLTPLTEDECEGIVDRLLNECGTDPLWVFGYGSLIWNPTFQAVESRHATAIGWHRSFCLKMTRWRATPKQPGLMLALDRGGRCNGIAYRLADSGRSAELQRLVRREMDFKEDLDMVRWITVQTSAGSVRALAFWAGPKRADGTSLKLPLEKVAWVLARACGHAGSCAEYLYNTVSHLEAHGIKDRNLWRLQHLVAEEIVRAYKQNQPQKTI